MQRIRKGRERPWRATTLFTAWPEVAEDPASAAASSLLSSVIAERYFEYLMRWLDAKPGEPEEWQRAAHFGDTMLYVTVDELVDLAEQTRAMMDRYLERLVHPELRPPGSRAVTYLHLAFPGDLSGTRETGAPQAGAAETSAREEPGGPGTGKPAGEAGARAKPVAGG